MPIIHEISVFPVYRIHCETFVPHFPNRWDPCTIFPGSKSVTIGLDPVSKSSTTRWIQHPRCQTWRTWNGEIASIIGTAGWISVTSRFPRAQQVGAPTVPGRSGPIRLRFREDLEQTKRCARPFLWADWTMSWWRKWLSRFCALEAVLGAISVVEMPAQVGKTQRSRESWRRVCRWILRTVTNLGRKPFGIEKQSLRT